MSLVTSTTLRRSIGRAFFSTSSIHKTVPFFQIDSFSKTPFHGNPAAVVLIPADIDLTDDNMTKIAAENNLVMPLLYNLLSGYASVRSFYQLTETWIFNFQFDKRFPLKKANSLVVQTCKHNSHSRVKRHLCNRYPRHHVIRSILELILDFDGSHQQQKCLSVDMPH